MVLRRWEPFRELRSMEDTINRMWSGFGGGAANPTVGGWSVPLDVVREGDSITVHASLPGVDPENVDVSVEDNLLTITAATGSDIEHKEGRVPYEGAPLRVLPPLTPPVGHGGHRHDQARVQERGADDHDPQGGVQEGSQADGGVGVAGQAAVPAAAAPSDTRPTGGASADAPPVRAPGVRLTMQWRRHTVRPLRPSRYST